MRNKVSIEEILKRYEYKDGQLYYKIEIANRKIKVGTKAGTIRKDGYTNIKIFNKYIKLHQIVFLMFNGYIPDYIDHIDRDRTNSRIENLREANMGQNQFNKEKKEKCSSKHKGVYFYKKNKVWVGRISSNNVRIRLGTFISEKEAALAYNKKAKELHGEFAILNIIN